MRIVHIKARGAGVRGQGGPAMDRQPDGQHHRVKSGKARLKTFWQPMDAAFSVSPKKEYCTENLSFFELTVFG